MNEEQIKAFLQPVDASPAEPEPPAEESKVNRAEESKTSAAKKQPEAVTVDISNLDLTAMEILMDIIAYDETSLAFFANTSGPTY